MRPIDIAAVPLGNICPGCKRITKHEHFKRSPFGDVICKLCYEADAAANPDIYGDPLAPQEIWQDVISQFHKYRLHRLKTVELGSTQCSLCDRIASERTQSAGIKWIKLSGGAWVCDQCYETSQAVAHGDWCIDSYGRCFYVTKTLRAKYPFGERKLPSLHEKCGYPALYEVQSQMITDLCSEYYYLAQGIAARYQEQRSNLLTVDQAHDIATTTLIHCASLYKEKPLTRNHSAEHVPRTFGMYLGAALKQSLKKQAIRNHDKLQPEELHDYEVACVPDAVVEEIEDERQAMWNSYQAKCKEIVGEENWELFASWILTSRTQREIGEELGITNQAMSMRFEKIIKICRHIASTNEQWQPLITLSLLSRD